MLLHEGDAGGYHHIKRKAAGEVYNQTNEFVHLGRNINHNDDLFIEVNRRIRNAWRSFRKCTFELYDGGV